MSDRFDVVDEWGKESFPASDPASGWQGPEEPPVDELVAELDGHRAFLAYVVDGDRLVLLHTEVPEAIAHHGVGGELVAAAVAIARDRGLTVVPRCPFARRWLSEHAEERAAVEVDWRR